MVKVDKNYKGSRMLAPYRQKVQDHSKHFLLWQKFYFLALIILVFQALFGEINQTLIGGIGLAALAIEMWPKFVEIWETLLGRIAVIVTYAILGNVVVVFAGHKLNEIIGVEPGALFYATSFVSLLTAPIWIVTITLIFMLFYMVIKQVWFFVTFIPWLIGLYEKSAIQVKRFPKLTRVTRILMVPFMFMFLVSVLDAYSSVFGNQSWFTELNGGLKRGLGNKETQQAIRDEIQKEKESEDLTPEELKATEVLEELFADKENELVTEDVAKADDSIVESNTNSEKEISAKDKSADSGPKVSVTGNGISVDADANMDHIIAAFVYHLEAFKYSQCEKTDDERIVPLGEHDILVAKPFDNELGYHFSVRECKLKEYSQRINSN